MTMKKLLAHLLRRLGLLRFDVLSTARPSYPDPASLSPEQVVVVEDGDIRKWVCLLCPGGCGAAISLPLNPERRPRWRVRSDFWTRPSVEPSIHQTNACACHFWIRDGRIDWCKDGRPRRP